ncbi:MAG TPA: hypothetical protein VFF11_03015, partial [Candidatus Binatia bacterium]|nr:hypothetical protein [Candidatus Binatia bacterium]
MTQFYAIGFYRLQLAPVSQDKPILAHVTEADDRQVQFTFIHVNQNQVKAGQVLTTPESFSEMVVET